MSANVWVINLLQFSEKNATQGFLMKEAVFLDIMSVVGYCMWCLPADAFARSNVTNFGW